MQVRLLRPALLVVSLLLIEGGNSSLSPASAGRWIGQNQTAADGLDHDYRASIPAGPQFMSVWQVMALANR